MLFGSRTIINGGILELSSLDGTNGFIINGESARDYAGRSVSSAGDVNGDGLSDIVNSGHLADPAGRTDAGNLNADEHDSLKSVQTGANSQKLPNKDYIEIQLSQ